jgi:hypothetical protein
LGRQCCWVRPIKSKIQAGPISILKSAKSGEKQEAVFLPDSKSLRRFRQSSRPLQQLSSDQVHNDQEEATEQPWQLVRKRRWWRKESTPFFNAPLPAVMQRQKEKFKDKMTGRCYNCLSTDHMRRQCRDPTKCWKCKKSDHISSRCSQYAHEQSNPLMHPRSNNWAFSPLPSHQNRPSYKHLSLHAFP